VPTVATIQSWLLGLHGAVVYVAVAVLVFVEVGIVVGFFVPGEIATIVGGVVASEHHASLPVMVVVVVGAAVAGNVAGYDLGRLVGPWLLARRPLRGSANVARAERLVAARGGPAVLVARWVAVVRALMPGIAGMSGMKRTVFVLYSVLGGVAWGTMWVLIGFAAGRSYETVVKTAGTWASVVVGAAIVGVGVFALWRHLGHRRRVRQLPTESGPDIAPLAPGVASSAPEGSAAAPERPRRPAAPS